jgi:OmcA/MtrC family decaheme c-type cytochrome
MIRAMGIGALAGAFLLGACGDSRPVEGEPQGGGATSGGAPVPEQPLVLDILSAQVPEGGGRPTVTFRVTMPDGTPVDLPTELANANASPAAFPNTVPRFTLAALDENGEYRSYYTSQVAPRDYTPPAGATPPPPGTFPQATFQPPTRNAAGPAPWPVADLVANGDGSYTYTMPETNETGFDRSRTHTVAGWAVRTTAAGAEALIGYDAVHFVPGGGTPSSTGLAVSDAGCAACHGFVQAHGTRRGVELCATCHSPQTTDPETSRTVDLKVMIHKIHRGADLPSVQQGTPYFIVGFQQTVLDFSHVAIPWYRGVRDCAVCHSGAAEGGRFASEASVAACGSCHDNVKFDGSASKTCGAAGGNAFDDCNHPVPTPDTSPGVCQACHDSTFVRTVHGQG